MTKTNVQLELPPDVAEEQAARQAFEQRALQMRISIALEIFTRFAGDNLFDYPIQHDDKLDMHGISNECLRAAAAFIAVASDEMV